MCVKDWMEICQLIFLQNTTFHSRPKWLLLSARYCCWRWRPSAAGLWSWWTRAWRSPEVDQCLSQRWSWGSMLVRLQTVRWRWWWTNQSLRGWGSWLHRWGHTCSRVIHSEKQYSGITVVCVHAGVWLQLSRGRGEVLPQWKSSAGPGHSDAENLQVSEPKSLKLVQQKHRVH